MSNQPSATVIEHTAKLYEMSTIEVPVQHPFDCDMCNFVITLLERVPIGDQARPGSRGKNAVSMHACMRKRESERESETERAKERESERERRRGRETEREKERARESESERERERERERISEVL